MLRAEHARLLSRFDRSLAFRRRVPLSPSRHTSRQCEIVTMDHLVAAAIAEDRFDFERALARNAFGVAGAICREPAGDFVTGTVLDDNRVATLETPVDLANAGGKETLSLRQGFGCT